MSDFYILKKEKLKDFLKTVMENFHLVGPQSINMGDYLFQEIQDLEKIDLNYDITSNTLKEFFFPRRETIFSYEKKTGSLVKITLPQNRIKKETIFFGVRACDVRAVYFQDCFFSQEPKDHLYWQKRDKSILISFACNKPPRQNCFCLVSGGPCLEKNEGFDLQFIDLPRPFYSEEKLRNKKERGLVNMYLVEIGTTKGADLIKKYKRFFSATDENFQEKKCHLKESCLKHFAKEYDIHRIYEKLKSENLKDLWDELGKRCTNCGGCEFICPTCFCFYTQDIEYSKNNGKRIRAWDSCCFSGYSRMAGEVNPHEKNSDRISRRFFCKLYNCYNWFKVFGCTGCGRCSFVCPVNLDMESFIASLMKANQYIPLLKEL